jgi:hypothetical protein
MWPLLTFSLLENPSIVDFCIIAGKLSSSPPFCLCRKNHHSHRERHHVRKISSAIFLTPKCDVVRHASNPRITMRFSRSSAATAGLYCTVGYAHIVSPGLRGVNRLSVFLSWGRWNVFAGGGG